MLGDLVFYAAVSFLLGHELDAIERREWRFVFVLRRLPDETAFKWFIVLHLPVLIGLLVLVAAEPTTPVRGIQAGVDVFLVAHAGLHEQLTRQGDPAFAGGFSRVLIWSSAGLAVAHLALLLLL